MGTLLTWYLVINYYRGGAIVIPQLSEQQCKDNRKWIISREESLNLVSIYCLPGRAAGR